MKELHPINPLAQELYATGGQAEQAAQSVWAPAPGAGNATRIDAVPVFDLTPRKHTMVPSQQRAETIPTPEAMAGPAEALNDALMPAVELVDRVMQTIDQTQAELTALYADNADLRAAAGSAADAVRWLYTGKVGEALPVYFTPVRQPEGLTELLSGPDVPFSIIETYDKALAAATPTAEDIELDRQDALGDAAREWMRQTPGGQLFESFCIPPLQPGERLLTTHEYEGAVARIGAAICDEFGVTMEELSVDPMLRSKLAHEVWPLDEATTRDAAQQVIPEDPLIRAKRHFGRILADKHAEAAGTHRDTPRIHPLRIEAPQGYSGGFSVTIPPTAENPKGNLELSPRVKAELIAAEIEPLAYDQGAAAVLAHRIKSVFSPHVKTFDGIMNRSSYNLEGVTADVASELEQPRLLGHSSLVPFLASVRSAPSREAIDLQDYFNLQEQTKEKYKHIIGENSTQHVTAEAYRDMEATTLGNVLLDVRSPEESAPPAIFMLCPVAEVPRAASDAEAVMRITFAAEAFDAPDQIHNAPGYAVISCERQPDGGQIVTYSRDTAGNPYHGDIPIDAVQRQKLIDHFDAKDMGTVSEAVAVVPHISMRALEDIIATEARYDLPQDQAVYLKKPVQGRPLLQCSTADLLLRGAMSKALSMHTTRAVHGLVIGSDGRLSAMRHQQTMVVRDQRRYIFDATPRTLYEGDQPADTDININTLLGQPGEPHEVRAAKPAALATKAATVPEAKAGPETVLSAEEQLNLIASRLKGIRTATDQSLRIQFGVDRNPAYAGPEGVATYMRDQYPAQSDMLRGAYSNIALASPINAASSVLLPLDQLAARCAAIDYAAENMALLSSKSPAEAQRLGLPSYQTPMLKYVAERLQAVRSQYIQLIKLRQNETSDASPAPESP